MNKVIGLSLYSTSLFICHNLLKHHYFNVCQSSLLSILWEDSRYCLFVDAMTKVLSAAPLAVLPLIYRSDFFSKNKTLDEIINNEEEDKIP